MLEIKLPSSLMVSTMMALLMILLTSVSSIVVSFTEKLHLGFVLVANFQIQTIETIFNDVKDKFIINKFFPLCIEIFDVASLV